MKKINVGLSLDLHKQLKILAAKRGEDLQKLVDVLIRYALKTK